MRAERKSTVCVAGVEWAAGTVGLGCVYVDKVLTGRSVDWEGKGALTQCAQVCGWAALVVFICSDQLRAGQRAPGGQGDWWVRSVFVARNLSSHITTSNSTSTATNIRTPCV